MEEKFLIEDVSDTAFWVAHYRAVETKKKSPLPWIFKLIQRFIPQEKRAVFQKFAGFSLLERC